MMQFSRLRRWILFLFWFIIMVNINDPHHQVAFALPFQLRIPDSEDECFIDTLKANEVVTVEAIVLHGDQLVATVHFDGPIPMKAEDYAQSSDLNSISTANLVAAIHQFDHSGHGHSKRQQRDDGIIHFEETIDFEHLNPDSLFHDDALMNSWDSEDGQFDDDDIMRSAVGTEDERKARQNEKRLHKRDERAQLLEQRLKERHSAAQQRKVREEGEPFVQSFTAARAGWYRFCIHASAGDVTVEVDFRKESELGGVNEDHDVWTYEEKQMAEEDRRMEEFKADKEGIKDEDFLETKEKMKTLRRLLAEIQTKQQQERHRINIHAQTNEHSHSRMVLGSLLETLLFMLVTGVQVYTIRKWFKGTPVLGR